MKYLLFLLVAALQCGCDSKPRWVLRREPTTAAEHKAVAELVERIMAATPRSLSGRNQDWDKAITAAHSAAENSLCRPTLWEWTPCLDGGGFTGRFKYAEEVENK